MDMSEINRRQFVLATGAAVCSCLAAGCASSGGPQAWTGPTTFELPAPSAIKEGIDTRWLTSGGFFLVRDNGRIFAVTSTCSHQACPLAAKGAEYVCPCHGSRFTPAGKVLVGPATKPLARFGTSLNPAGHIVVDRTRVFPDGQWEQSGAFVTV
jgi:nitrite reductase/ring-hydroxylating ferredoxin subunit